MEIIENLTAMIKKAFLSFAVALLALSSSHASVDFGAPTRSTPYDPYLSPVKHVLTHLGGNEPSMQRVRELMHVGRGFRYSFTTPYTAATPEVTAATHAGDCKAKALWLAAQLNDSSVRFVIGKARASSRVSHAWLLWQQDAGHSWILDCTNTSEPILAERTSNREYIPIYSFDKRGAYRHGQVAYASNSRQTPVAQADR